MTFTVTVQVPPAASVPLEKEIEPAPATGAYVGVPHPVVDAPVGLATTIAPGATGKVSENATPLRESSRLGFVTVKVNVETPLARMGLGENNFEITGGFKTVRAAEALPVEPVFVPPLVDEMNPLTF